MENDRSSFTGVTGRYGTVGSVWYTRCKSPWKLASEEQIKSVTAYLDTHDENQPIGEFKDVRFKQATIYTVYCSGDTLVELLYDDPKHVAYIESLR